VVRLWDLSAQDPAAAPVDLPGHKGGIGLVIISPDNRWLVTAGSDGKVRLWPLPLDVLIDQACRAAGRNLTRQEWDLYFPEQAYRKTCEQWSLYSSR
jgi:WD40 repeat protein